MIGKSLAASRSSNRDFKKTLEGDSITMEQRVEQQTWSTNDFPQN